MNTQRSGFSLIEFIVYFAVLMVFCMVAFQTMTYTYQHLFGYGKHNNKLVEWYTARDLLMRDLHELPYDTASFIVLKEHELLWRTGNKEIGWLLDGEQQRLVRSHREYDEKNKRWKQMVKSLVATGITQLTFVPTRDERGMRAMEFSFEGRLFGRTQTMKQLVATRNREIA